jgi:D-serine dehydratase
VFHLVRHDTRPANSCYATRVTTWTSTAGGFANYVPNVDGRVATPEFHGAADIEAGQRPSSRLVRHRNISSNGPMTTATTDHSHSTISWRTKGFPAIVEPVPASRVGDLGWNLFDGRFLFPTMVLHLPAMDHNIALLAEYAQTHGVSLAPHGKASMAPEIFRRQLAAGAWAITVATAWQARVAAKVGIQRILIANLVVDDAGLAWIAETLDEDGPEIICYADSIAAVRRMDARLSGRRRRLHTLVEVGVTGGRTGARTLADALEVARAIAASRSLDVAGVAFFEGVVPETIEVARIRAVRKLATMARHVAETIDREVSNAGLDELIVTGGGSKYVDTVVEELERPWSTSRPVRLVIRCGSYVTHDDGTQEAMSPFGSKAPVGAPRLRPALEAWAIVLSVPDPGRAILGAGRRDLPYDGGMPVVLKIHRPDGVFEAAADMTVTALNDQHAYLAIGEGTHLAVGDQVGLGISHPCSAFDRWRFVAGVDDSYRVVEAIELIF